MKKLMFFGSILLVIFIAGCTASSCNSSINLDYPKEVSLSTITPSSDGYSKVVLNLIVDNSKGSAFTITDIWASGSAFWLTPANLCTDPNHPECVEFSDIRNKRIEAGESITIPIIATLTGTATIDLGPQSFTLYVDTDRQDCGQKSIDGVITVRK